MAAWIVVALLVLVAAAVPVAAVLGILTLGLDQIYMDGRLKVAIGEFTWDKSKEFILVAIPMFILLGEIMLRAGVARRMYNAVAQWLSWLPGGLMHANIGSCAILAASSGSSVATAATVGTVAYPEIAKRGYNEKLFLGSLAAGGTLGILIPPSINLIIYGLITNTSVPELYLAGILPGLILSLLFIFIILVACLFKPSWGGTRMETTWAERIRVLPDLIPPILLFGVVVGSIYAGVATPTEAASVGVCFALLLAAWNRTLTIKMLLEAFEGTMRTTAMIMLIILAAVFLNFILGFMGITQALIKFIEDLGLTPLQTLLLIVIFYLILGMFMETLSMLLTTVPIVFPLIVKLGYDPVWFGILITVLMEAALITPPIGVNLYVVQGIRQRGGNFNDVAYGAMPFVVMMIAMIALLIAFPQIALYLPTLVYR
ncbi:MAG: TRAP transporter large permease [Hyphomicrobiaceae bacterium]|nr:TRAP transporter large permease [Hyphomicrobiaceae bacterium]